MIFLKRTIPLLLTAALLGSVLGGCVRYSDGKPVGSEETSKETPKAEEKKLSAEEQLEQIKKEDAAEQEKKKKDSGLLMDGENGVLADDVFIGLGEDKKNYEEMFTYITKGNQAALAQMVSDGKVLFAEKGTPITVVDRGFVSAHIQVIGTKDRGWVPVEYLAKEGN